METKDLEYFIAVHDCGSIMTAAEKLFISPQGLSKAIARLEGEVGHQLFVRSNRGAAPTDFAQRLYPVACKVVDLVDSIANNGNELPAETLSIASASGYLLTLGEGLWDGFERRAGGVRVSVEEVVDREVGRLVAEGLVDCGWMPGPIDFERLDAVLLHRHPFVVVAHRDSPLALHKRVSYRDLDGLVVTHMGEGFAAYGVVRNRLAQNGANPARLVGVMELSTGFGYVARNEGVHITADFVARDHVRPNMVVLPFEDAQFSWDTYFVTRRSSHPGPYADLLCSYLAEKLADVFGPGLPF